MGVIVRWAPDVDSVITVVGIIDFGATDALVGVTASARGDVGIMACAIAGAGRLFDP